MEKLELLNELKRKNLVHLISLFAFLAVTMFIFIYGNIGMHATEILIQNNEITPQEILGMTKNFLFVILLSFIFITLCCGYCYYLTNKFIKHIISK